MKEFIAPRLNINSVTCTASDIASLHRISRVANLADTLGRETLNKRYPDELKLLEKLPCGKRFVIPREYLWGRQTREDYSKKKTKKAREEFKARGIDFLKDFPIISIALPESEGLQLVIYDGHHRVKEAPGFNIAEIPCQIYTPEQVVKVFNEQRNDNNKLNVDAFTDQLRRDVRLATESRPNKLVEGITSIEDLPTIFKSFEIDLKPGQEVSLI